MEATEACRVPSASAALHCVLDVRHMGSKAIPWKISSMRLAALLSQVKATAGSTRLGGEAFDIRLTYLLADEFQRQQMPMVRRASVHGRSIAACQHPLNPWSLRCA